MERSLKKYLTDILFSIEEIENFMAQRPRQFSVFLSDSMFRSAIERKVMIIGEAMNQALKLDSELQISNARKIVSTRNYVVHAYDSLQPDTIWNIVINHIPILKEEVKALLDES